MKFVSILSLLLSLVDAHRLGLRLGDGGAPVRWNLRGTKPDGKTLAAKSDQVQTPEECPVPDETVPCILSWAPVVCGELDCFYANDCVAEATHVFNATLDCSPWTDNETTEQYSAEPAEETLAVEDAPPEECPGFGLVACNLMWAPVVCGELECFYANDCLAAATNAFDIARDCTPYIEQALPVEPSEEPFMEPDEVATEDSSKTTLAACPVGIAPCPRNYAPVTCGESNCSYNNHCIAEAAGFNVANDCVEAWPQSENECPVGSGPCIASYAPVECGPNNCFYDNECLADLAHFNVAEDCVAV